MPMPKIAPAAIRAALLSPIFLGFPLHGAIAKTISPASDDAARGETVSWTITAPSGPVKLGSLVSLTLQGTVLDGWHVYGLSQLPAGPTPLKVSLDKNEIAKTVGKISGSAPVKVRDQAFGLEVEYYSHAVSVTVPVRIAAKSVDGPQQIPVSVRFQTCNDRICQPPKTVHLSAPISVRTDG